MVFHKDFPVDPHTIMDSIIRWFPADKAVRETAMNKLPPPLVPAIPSLSLFAVFRAWGVSVEERRKPIPGGLTAASLLPTSSPNTPHALFELQIGNCCAGAGVVPVRRGIMLEFAALRNYDNNKCHV